MFAATAEFLKATYDVEVPVEVWLERPLPHLLRLCGVDTDTWALAATYRITPEGSLAFATVSGLGLTDSVLRAFADVADRSPPEWVNNTYRRMPYALATEVALPNQQPVFDRLFREVGSRDILIVNGVDPDGAGVLLSFGVPREARLSRRLPARVRQLAAHVRTAHRCRLRLKTEGASTAFDGAEAVFDDAGAPRFCSDAVGTRARDALRTATVEFSRMQVDGATDCLARTPRVGVRWTLLDAFTADGKRFVVARENLAAVSGLALLSERERQVVAALSVGQSTKEVAYDLGISASTARVLLSRALAKLGIGSRRELISVTRPSRT
jgi:DNA-binding CsgD family transcriptional regulator